MLKNLPDIAGDIREVDSIPGSGRSPGGRHRNHLQYSCLENPIDRGAWWATVRKVTKSWTRLKRLNRQVQAPLKIVSSRRSTKTVAQEDVELNSPHEYIKTTFKCGTVLTEN